jgi:chromosome segregation protein
VEVAVWLDTLDKLSAAAKKAEEDYASASFVLQQAHEDLEKLYAQAERMGEDLRLRDAELENTRIKVSMLESVHQQLEGQMAVLRGNVENNDRNIARIQEELQGQENRSGGIDQQIRQTKQRISQIEQDLTEKRQQLQQLQQQLAVMTASAQGTQKQFLELRTEESTLMADLAGREADIRGLEQAMEQSNARIRELDVDLASGDERRSQAQTQLDGTRRELRRAQEDVTAANNTISGYSLRQKTRLERRDNLQEKVKDITAKYNSVSAKARVFRAMERDFESYQKSVKLVMQEAQRGTLKNIHGPVSRLIRTEDEYAIAIEIATTFLNFFICTPFFS